jgi:hypothetical protein
MKISNHQINYQPQSGLSSADLIFEYYIGWGANRFAALYYGQDSDRIGPVRSIRRVDGHLGSLYQAVVGSTGGDGNDVLPCILYNYIPGRTSWINYLCQGCMTMVVTWFTALLAIHPRFTILYHQGYGLVHPDMSVWLSGIPPVGGAAGASAWITLGRVKAASFLRCNQGKLSRVAMDEKPSKFTDLRLIRTLAN